MGSGYARPVAGHQSPVTCLRPKNPDSNTNPNWSRQPKNPDPNANTNWSHQLSAPSPQPPTVGGRWPLRLKHKRKPRLGIRHQASGIRHQPQGGVCAPASACSGMSGGGGGQSPGNSRIQPGGPRRWTCRGPRSLVRSGRPSSPRSTTHNASVIPKECTDLPQRSSPLSSGRGRSPRSRSLAPAAIRTGGDRQSPATRITPASYASRLDGGTPLRPRQEAEGSVWVCVWV